MGSFKVNDSFVDHPKALAAGNAAVGVWVRAGAWSIRHKTNGFIPAVLIPSLTAGNTAIIEPLVETKLWDVAPDGYWIHGWAECNSADVSTPKRKSLSRRVALAVFERDGFRCVHCGVATNLSVDHIVPLSRGGTDGFENLQTLCLRCNSSKGASI